MRRQAANSRPRHRAQRQGIWPSSRARLNNASTRPVSAAIRSATSATRPVIRAIETARRTAIDPEYRRLIRGVLFTPWFAVSAGIVIAAALTLATPSAALTFPPSTGGQCVDAGCAATGKGTTGPSPAIKGEVKLRAPQQHHGDALAPVVPVSRAVHGVQVQYGLLLRHDDRFVAEIVIISRKSLGKWSLKFALPGIHIESIIWAKWVPDGSGGVLVDGSQLPWARSAANQAKLVIFGTGTPSWPQGCVFDGARCTFRALSDSGQHPGNGTGRQSNENSGHGPGQNQ